MQIDLLLLKISFHAIPFLTIQLGQAISSVDTTFISNCSLNSEVYLSSSQQAIDNKLCLPSHNKDDR